MISYVPWLAAVLLLASCARAPVEVAEAIPARADGAVRVLSFNT